MTCEVPSDRVVVPASDACAPAPAVGVPLAVSGGQAAAHASLHSLVVPESFTVAACAPLPPEPVVALALVALLPLS